MGIVGLHRCSINYSAGEAFLIEWALLRLAAITFPGPSIAVLSSSAYTVIMPVNDGCHIGHATITDLDRISVEDFMQCRTHREVFIDKP